MFLSSHTLCSPYIKLTIPHHTTHPTIHHDLRSFIIAFSDLEPERKELLMSQIGFPLQNGLALLSLWVGAHHV
jgi:hypothetical protein